MTYFNDIFNIYFYFYMTYSNKIAYIYFYYYILYLNGIIIFNYIIIFYIPKIINI